VASILLRLPVEAPPRAIYESVATSEGVNGWWSNHTEGPSGVGSTMVVAFPDAPMTFDFVVAEEVPDKRVAWRCLAGPPEWIDTDVTFDIERAEEGDTSVLFTHGGWRSTDDSFPFIAYSWAQILPRLKQLVETRERNPYFSF
jgi:hypothetical protein